MNIVLVISGLTLLFAALLAPMVRRWVAGIPGQMRRLTAMSLVSAPAVLLLLSACSGKGK